VKLVDKQIHGVLEKFEVKSFEALGEPFDPAKHEAIQQLETAEHPPGAVAKVFARGYTIGTRLLRPAMVAVAKAPAAPPEGGESPAGEG
jgi:molecular chaperone GrpE